MRGPNADWHAKLFDPSGSEGGALGCLFTRVKLASKALLASIRERLAALDRFWEKEQTKADVEVFVLDAVYASLPTPPFTSDEKEAVAGSVYAYVWQQAVSGDFLKAA